MASIGSENSTSAYVTAEQLRIGLFVMLDLPWYKHSFTLNSFKIRTQDQLRELRALKLSRYPYDPQRSDALPDTPVVMTTSAKVADAPDNPTPTLPDEPANLSALEQQRRQMNLQRREKVAQIEKSFAKAATVMKSLNRKLRTNPHETLDEMGELVDTMVDAFLNSPEVTLHVMGDKAGGEDVYFHSLNVTLLAMMLTKDLNFSLEQARDMGIGAMLHDVGLAEIPDRITKKPASDFTQAERNLRATHVDLGLAMGRRFGLSDASLAVVGQHHELADGSGYPRGIDRAGIHPAAQLVSMVNFYDNLCNPVDSAKAMTPHEALSHMFAQCKGKFDAHALQLLIRSLGVHPPGSILQLSNGMLAVVTSVNPKKPLRPWVLIYDEAVPKDEAVTLNLEHEPTLSILKSIRPSQLPPKIAAYLNPRKRITYFFDAGTNPVASTWGSL